MADYAKITDFAAKDALAPGNPAKIITGTSHDNEFNAISVAIATKADKASPTFTGTVTIPTPFTLGATSVTSTGTELNYVAGVTSAIQTQINAKAPTASPTFTGTDAGVTLTRTGTLTTTAGEIFCYGFGSTTRGVVRFNQAGTAYIYWDSSTFSVNGAMSIVGTVYSSGAMTSASSFTGTDFIISSDARLKKDVRIIEDSGAFIDALTGYRYTFKDTGRKSAGFIAQEVQQVAPELVTEGEDGFLRLSQQPLIAVLWEEVKSLRARVASLEAK